MTARPIATCSTLVALDRSVDVTARALRSGRRTGAVVLELDVARGELAWRAGVELRRTLADLASLPVDDVGAAAVAAVTWRSPLGIDVISGPCCAELGEVITPELVSRVLDVLLESGRDVFVDASCAFDARVLAACRASDSIVLVGGSSDHAATVAARIVDLLGRCGVPTVPTVERARVSRASIAALVPRLPIRPAPRGAHG